MKQYRYIISVFLLISNIACAQKLENLVVAGPLLSKSSLHSDTIRMIPKDSVVSILPEPSADGYYYVAYEGNKGFVQKNLLTVTVLPIDIKKYKLNQFNDKGKKDSLWIEYLDAKWKPLKDSTKAVYYRYAFFFRGKDVAGGIRGEGKSLKLKYMGDSEIQNNKPAALDGEYKWFDCKGRLILDYYYLKGQRIWEKDYFWGFDIKNHIVTNKKRTGKKLAIYIDYRRKLLGRPFTAYCEIYNRKDKFKVYCLQFYYDRWGYVEQ